MWSSPSPLGKYAAHLLVGKVLVYARCVETERLREARGKDPTQELVEKITPKVLFSSSLL